MSQNPWLFQLRLSCVSRCVEGNHVYVALLCHTYVDVLVCVLGNVYVFIHCGQRESQRAVTKTSTPPPFAGNIRDRHRGEQGGHGGEEVIIQHMFILSL